MSDDEYERVRERANTLGLSVPRMMLEVALAPSSAVAATQRADVGELFAIRMLNGALGRNLNQIARAVNSGQLPPQPALDAALQKLMELIAREHAVLDGIQNAAGPT